MGAPLIVIGLDGATLDLVRPWAAAGRLPNLAGLMARGAWGVLRSTLPAATFPAWTSLVTGVNPGRHGVLDFTERVPGSYRVRLVNGSYRETPALWTRLVGAGRRVVVLTVPATYPPEPVDGVMVSGFDSPLATAIDGSFVHPRARYADIRRWVGRLPFADFQEIAPGPGWHGHALAQLRDGIRRRTKLACALLAAEQPDALMVVFGQSDTVAHHFWRFHDRGSPRFVPSEFGGAIGEIYQALDTAVGELLRAAPRGAAVAVVSDHGSGGAGDRAVHLNRRLAECGLLGFRANAGGRFARLARKAALTLLPPRVQGLLVRRLGAAAGRLEGMARLAGIDWRRTRAFSEELDYHPSVWLNLRGREPEGTVAPGEYERVRDEVVAALASWTDAAGCRVVRHVWRREDVYHGPCVTRAPDLVLELAYVEGYSPSCLRSEGCGPGLRRLMPQEFAGGRGRGMNGSHRRDGLVILAGEGVRPVGEMPPAEITDVLPTLLALAGVPVPSGLDGQPLTAALGARPATAPDPLVSAAVRRSTPFTHDEARQVAARLAALGYLEPEA